MSCCSRLDIDSSLSIAFTYGSLCLRYDVNIGAVPRSDVISRPGSWIKILLAVHRFECRNAASRPARL